MKRLQFERDTDLMMHDRQERKAKRAQRQMLEHYRDLQATLYSLSQDFGQLGFDLPYNITLTKTFYAHAHDGTALKATLSITLAEQLSNT